MHRFLSLLILCQLLPAAAGAQSPLPYNPVAEYITPGQDEPGYKRWYAAASWRPVYVRAFHDYLVTNGVGGVAPTWQLLRTATDWQKCGAEPFEVPPSWQWPNIVATLHFIGANIMPVVGRVEPVSVYRNDALNSCAGGAATSTHRETGAIDMVPLRAVTREALMSQLCAIHAAHPSLSIGLGFYKGVRFHIDARKHREWGTAGANGGAGCVAVLAEGAAHYMPATGSATAPLVPPANSAALPERPDPLAPIASPPPR